MKEITTVITMFLLMQCAENLKQSAYTPEVLTVIPERDLIPEGTAYDPVTEQVFIGGMYKRKIIAIRSDGSYYDFVKEGQDSIWAPIGMEVDTTRKKLWVISGKGAKGIVTRIQPSDPSWNATLYCYDISTANLSGIYHAVHSISGDFCFNDLAVSEKGDVYLTESLTNRIFVLPSGADSIDVFAEPKGYSFLNGITLSGDEKFVYISSTESLLILHTDTREVYPLTYLPTVEPRPIDGLAYYNNSLIGHQGRKINRFYFNKTMDTIVRHETIDSTGLDSSTTGEVGSNGWYYYIANSQIRSGIDYEKMQIMPWDSLEPVEIRKVRL